MIGVDWRYLGKDYGGDLLVDALKRIATAADAIRLAVAMLDVLDDGGRGGGRAAQAPLSELWLSAAGIGSATPVSKRSYDPQGFCAELKRPFLWRWRPIPYHLVRRSSAVS